jgi:hypothetical protein
MDLMAGAFLVGSGATAATDLWAAVRSRLLGIAPPDFCHVGRWLGHLTRGRMRHAAIAAAPPVRLECLIGWVAHYVIGIAFAALLLGAWGSAWLRQPALVPALIVGIGTVVAPLLVMQPAMGVPFAARRALHSLVTHLFFGVGLYAAGRITNLIFY